MQFITQLFSEGKDILSNFDKFASSYQAPKRTKKGAVVSLLIHAFSFGYFGFLAYQYGSNQIEPSVAYLQTMNFNKHTFNLTQDLFAFQYFSGTDGSLDAIQQANNLVYLIFEVHYYDHKTSQKINIPLKYCQNSDPNLAIYYCPDFSQAKDSNGQNLQLVTLRQPQTELILTAKRCSGLPNCALSTDIDNLISQFSYFDIILFANQYNHISNQFETIYDQETYYLDVSLGIFSKIKIVNAITNVYSGLFASTKTNSNSAAYEFKRSDQYNSNQLLTLENNQNSLLFLSFDLDAFSVKLDIQYSTLMALVPVAISLGEIAFSILKAILPNFSKNALTKDLMTANLKGSFAKTAQQLLQKNLNKEQKQEKDDGKSKQQKGKQKGEKEDDSDGKGKKEDTDEGSQQKTITSPEDLIKQAELYQDQAKNIYSLVTKSVGGDWESIIALFKMIAPCLKKKVTGEVQKQKEKIQALQKKSSPEQDLNSSVEDILFLKKAIRLLLTKEQYAAVHFCGSDCQDDQKDEKQDTKKKSQISPQPLLPINDKNEKKNHLEAIDTIEKDQKEMMNSFKSYIKSTSYDQEQSVYLTDLDKRILNSLIFDFSPNGNNNALNGDKQEKKTGNSSPLISNYMKDQMQKYAPDLISHIPGISEITDLLKDEINEVKGSNK
ncbi:transmembrane protein, putative (macronuclear) [Tetrahymena thermophila SB210]|uniref:Transmembrane protein, putative n=1 Tax=Tetrahymena thermophila (strain SB210) TaxID=312017 RepID=Q22R70_TETTS|nr:transmembrane protein, putative [Tetrahymena thermophila SB210]EAR88252.1 transmembrane protein, putative [Tetrahymena thermophila SB210]|eukprot:XP_001008497.1 transmembrane protein, putative [Tetrahymena thermophila SB210]